MEHGGGAQAGGALQLDAAGQVGDLLVRLLAGAEQDALAQPAQAVAGAVDQPGGALQLLRGGVSRSASPRSQAAWRSSRPATTARAHSRSA
jgi:hypothetical protein